jgi:Bacterial Ig domain/IPT/TIG domain
MLVNRVQVTKGRSLSGACISLMHVFVGLLQAQTLQITSPVDGAVVRPGQTLTISVSASPPSAFQSMIIIGQGPLGYSQILTGPPYQFSLQVPADISPRRYRITADGVTAPGQGASSPSVTLSVERADSPVSLKTEPSVLQFRMVGDLCPLHVIGSYADGTETDITESLSTTYASNDPAIATVNSFGVVTAMAPGTTRIVVNGSYSLPVTVRPRITVMPPQRALHAGQSQQFFAKAADPAVPGVVWSISPSGAGSISSSGLYSAPASITSSQSVIVTASNSADSTQSASVAVSLYPPVSVSASPAAVVLGPSQTQTFAAVVQNATYAGVIWSADPPGIGSISSAGIYTAPATIPVQQLVSLTATSVADMSKSSSSVVTLKPPAPGLASCSPASGIQGSIVPVTLTGSNFISGATVVVSNAGVTVSSITVVSATQITAMFTLAASAPLGAANVTVTTSGGTSAPTVFTVNAPPPVVTSISPGSGRLAFSEFVTISGTGFAAGATVAVSDPEVTVRNVTIVDSTQITATFDVGFGASLGAANVTVTTSGGTSNAAPFTISSQPPGITALSPASLTRNSSQDITIMGSFFTPDATVTVSNPGVSVLYPFAYGPNMMSAIFVVAADAALGPCNVIVTTASGSSAAAVFTVM